MVFGDRWLYMTLTIPTKTCMMLMMVRTSIRAFGQDILKLNSEHCDHPF